MMVIAGRNLEVLSFAPVAVAAWLFAWCLELTFAFVY